MTLLEVEELTRYWIEHPPLHIAMAAFLGVRRRGKRGRPAGGSGPASRNTDPASLLAELGAPGLGAGDVHAGLPPVMLDFTALKHQTSS